MKRFLSILLIASTAYVQAQPEPQRDTIKEELTQPDHFEHVEQILEQTLYLLPATLDALEHNPNEEQAACLDSLYEAYSNLFIAHVHELDTSEFSQSSLLESFDILYCAKHPEQNIYPFRKHLAQLIIELFTLQASSDPYKRQQNKLYLGCRHTNRLLSEVDFDLFDGAYFMSIQHFLSLLHRNGLIKPPEWTWQESLWFSLKSGTAFMTMYLLAVIAKKLRSFDPKAISGEFATTLATSATGKKVAQTSDQATTLLSSLSDKVDSLSSELANLKPLAGSLVSGNAALSDLSETASSLLTPEKLAAYLTQLASTDDGEQLTQFITTILSRDELKEALNTPELQELLKSLIREEAVA